MTHPSLFKEAAQRIVQRAQSSENQADSSQAVQGTPGFQAGGRTAATQMSAGTFGSSLPLTSPTDTSQVPRR
jgi:hypothetical protein